MKRSVVGSSTNSDPSGMMIADVPVDVVSRGGGSDHWGGNSSP